MSDPTPIPDARAVACGFVDPSQDRIVKSGYLRWFAPAARVLDAGCGAGTFLELWQQVGGAGRGIDAAASAVVACRERGLDVVHGDLLVALERLDAAGERFGGVLVAHVIEHLPGELAARMVELVARVLEPGGRAVFVTPNVRNLVVLEETFWLDPTHLRPYPRPLIERFCLAAGLQVVASYDDPATRPRRPAWKQVLARLRSVLSGADRAAPMDAVVVSEREGSRGLNGPAR